MPNEMTAGEAAEILENMAEKDFQSDGTHFEADENIAINYAASILRRVASGELAEVVRAHWVFGHTQGHLWMKCSHCLKSQSGHTATFDYYPNCGALMGGKDDRHE